MRRPRGFATFAAIFIVVVLAALGAFILGISSSQHIGSALDVQGVRAYHAARAGIEWGVYRVQATPAYNFGYASSDANLRACPPSPASFSPPGDTLAGFTVTVTCTATADGSGGPTVFAVVATACSEPSAGACPNTANPGAHYIERRLDVAF